MDPILYFDHHHICCYQTSVKRHCPWTLHCLCRYMSGASHPSQYFLRLPARAQLRPAHQAASWQIRATQSQTGELQATVTWIFSWVSLLIQCFLEFTHAFSLLNVSSWCHKKQNQGAGKSKSFNFKWNNLLNWKLMKFSLDSCLAHAQTNLLSVFAWGKDCIAISIYSLCICILTCGVMLFWQLVCLVPKSEKWLLLNFCNLFTSFF